MRNVSDRVGGGLEGWDVGWVGACVWGSEMEGWGLGRVSAVLRSLFCYLDNGDGEV